MPFNQEQQELFKEANASLLAVLQKRGRFLEADGPEPSEEAFREVVGEMKKAAKLCEDLSKTMVHNNNASRDFKIVCKNLAALLTGAQERPKNLDDWDFPYELRDVMTKFSNKGQILIASSSTYVSVPKSPSSPMPPAFRGPVYSLPNSPMSISPPRFSSPSRNPSPGRPVSPFRAISQGGSTGASSPYNGPEFGD